MSMREGTHDPRKHVPGSDLESFGIMPDKLRDRGNRGWGEDEDRTSEVARKLRDLVTDMDTRVTAWLSEADQGIDEAEDICRLWVAIRKITQGRDITEVTE